MLVLDVLDHQVLHIRRQVGDVQVASTTLHIGFSFGVLDLGMQALVGSLGQLVQAGILIQLDSSLAGIPGSTFD